MPCGTPARPCPCRRQTGFALSPDGSAWTEQGLVIPEGPAGSFDAASADYPSVILDGSMFRIWYSGQNNSGTYGIGYATAAMCGAPLARAVYLPLVLRGAGGQPMCPPYYTDNFSDPGSGWSIADSVGVRSAISVASTRSGSRRRAGLVGESGRQGDGLHRRGERPPGQRQRRRVRLHFGLNDDANEYYNWP